MRRPPGSASAGRSSHHGEGNRRPRFARLRSHPVLNSASRYQQCTAGQVTGGANSERICEPLPLAATLHRDFMPDTGFPVDEYTPHGYLANPFSVAHSWTEGEGG